MLKATLGWLYFLGIQALALALFPVGVVVCAALTTLGATAMEMSTVVPGRLIETWRGGWLTYLFANDEDGVWGPPAYNPTASRWLTFKWSALRNPVNNLRFLTAWKGGPWFQTHWNMALRCWYFQVGFRPDNGWPVLSAGRGAGTVL